MQTNSNNFNNNNDEDWKLPNNQTTTEFRRKVIRLVNFVFLIEKFDLINLNY
jgi:hypothetical protein